MTSDSLTSPAKPTSVQPGDPMIELVDVHKHFGETHALDGINLSVAAGELVGLLGPNGAGKTTTINLLATLITPDAGSCRVGGIDPAKDPAAVRSMIGLTGQFAALDDMLTAKENLELFGRLLKLGHQAAKERSVELLERFDLVEAADRRVGGFSGGMRRRLDLAVSMIASPMVLFLDEPTTGLDPRSRQALWDVVRDLRSAGVTILLTTQYLEEADQLADRIVVIDSGTVIASGTATELKALVGGTVLELTVPDDTERARVCALFAGAVEGSGNVVTVPGDDPNALLRDAARLVEAGITVANVAIHRPTLDDVFLTLTGHATRGKVDHPEEAA